MRSENSAGLLIETSVTSALETLREPSRRCGQTAGMVNQRSDTGRLSGPRSTLRQFRSDDATDIAESCQDPDIPRYTFMPDAMTEDQARAWIDRRLELRDDGLHSFAITLPPDDRPVGQMGVHVESSQHRAETFYWLDRRFRGQGLAAEALDVLTRWVFAEHDVVRAHLITHLENEASQRVAERCGYRREGVLRAWEPIKDAQPDVIMWSRLASDPTPDLSRP